MWRRVKLLLPDALCASPSVFRSIKPRQRKTITRSLALCCSKKPYFTHHEEVPFVFFLSLMKWVFSSMVLSLVHISDMKRTSRRTGTSLQKKRRMSCCFSHNMCCSDKKHLYESFNDAVCLFSRRLYS